MKYSIAIPTIRGHQRIKQLIDSIAQYETPDEIVVSDDHHESIEKESETTQHFLANQEYFKTIGLNIIHTQPDQWAFLAGNWNNTVEHCTHDLVFLLNDDTYLTGPAFSETLAQIPTLINMAGATVPFYEPPHGTWEGGIIGNQRGKNIQGIHGCSNLIRKSIWIEMNRFDIESQLVEDEYCCYSIIHGYDIYSVSIEHPIIHLHGQSGKESGVICPPEISQGSPESFAAFKRKLGVDYMEWFHAQSKYWADS